MPAKLFGKRGKFKDVEVTIGTGKTTIGKDRSNDIVLAASSISRQHAVIEYDASEERYYLTDLGSMNGTELDGMRVRGREPLAHLNVITFAHHSLFFQDLERCARRHSGAAPAVVAAVSPSPEETQRQSAPPEVPPSLGGGGGAIAPPDATAVEAAPPELPTSLRGGETATPDEDAPTDELDGTLLEPAAPELPTSLRGAGAATPESEASATELAFVLEIGSPDGGSRRIPLRQGDNVVGRSTDAAVQISAQSVSRRHAVITVDGGVCRVRDEGSSNHTYVENQKVQREVEVPAGARLRFGDVEARIVRTD